MTFPGKPTTRDLSDLPENKDFPGYHSSMAGGNMVTNKDTRFSGQGTDSEATHDVVAGEVRWTGDAHDVPVFSDTGTSAPDLDVDEKGSGGAPSTASTWKGLH
jgi:hypothetical protein